jgi:hypothetical protein
MTVDQRQSYPAMKNYKIKLSFDLFIEKCPTHLLSLFIFYTTGLKKNYREIDAVYFQ